MHLLDIFYSQNFDLLTMGITIAGIGILGFLVYFNNKNSITNQTFCLLAVIDIFYAIANYFSYKTDSANVALISLRLVLFSAVLYSVALFQLFYVFPEKSIKFSKLYKYFVIPTSLLAAFLTLTPWVFERIDHLAPIGQVSNPVRGPAIPVFGIVISALVIGGMVLLIKKTRQAKGEVKKQLKVILAGTVITYTLIMAFNFILPVVFNNLKFIPLAPIFTIAFIGFTAYAIIRHHLLDVKVIATEFLTFFLSVAALFEILFSESATAALARFLIFLLILSLGIFLDRSVRREVQQRVQLEELSKQLADANEKLQALDKARAEFISIASHQLRTPPATVKWFLGSILAGDYGELAPEVKTALEKTQRTNNSLISLIEDMLNVSRIERGKMEFLFEPVSLLELADLTYEQLLPIASDKKLNLTFKKPTRILPQITADKEKIRQVMNNLIDNAIKYTKEGTVAVELFQDADSLRFQVKDSGKGIGPQEITSIFEKYSRGKESIKQSAGLGLGLYVAKAIISQHKGKIWAESAGEGKGSTFIFTIPIHNDLKATTLLDFTANQT